MINVFLYILTKKIALLAWRKLTRSACFYWFYCMLKDRRFETCIKRKSHCGEIGKH